jgi:hypothetical protein
MAIIHIFMPEKFLDQSRIGEVRELGTSDSALWTIMCGTLATDFIAPGRRDPADLR